MPFCSYLGIWRHCEEPKRRSNLQVLDLLKKKLLCSQRYFNSLSRLDPAIPRAFAQYIRSATNHVLRYYSVKNDQKNCPQAGQMQYLGTG
jgi:hypothetical protein